MKTDITEKVIDQNKVVFFSKQWWKNFGKRISPTLSKLSKAFLLPIALLPIAGIFLGVGAAISSNSPDASFGFYLGSTMNKMGDVCFGNLPILFAISVAMAYTKDSGVAAITAVVGFLVLNGMQAALLHSQTVENNVYAALTDIDGKILGFASYSNGEWAAWVGDTPGVGQNITYFSSSVAPTVGGVIDSNTIMLNSNLEKIDGAGKILYSLLWINGIPNGLITSNLGVNSLNTGVFAAIFVGAISAYAYNKFHAIQLPSAISFFSGTKFVPIIAFMLVVPLSFIFMFLWPYLGQGLAWFGQKSGEIGYGVDSFVFEIIERSLVPFGLHHVFYAPLWWTNAGGSIAEAFNNVKDATEQQRLLDLYNSFFKNNTFTSWANLREAIAKTSLWGAMGDQNMAYAVNGNLDIMNYTFLQELGLNIGRFQSGKFGFMLFGLPAAGVAMFLNVPKENRKSVMGIYFSAAFTCFLTGITEPLEYTFLFLAPWLFYGVHMPLAAFSFLFAGLLQTHVSMTVSGGFIDYIVFGLIPFFGNNAMGAWNVFGVLLVGVAMAFAYFFAFYFAVKYGNVMVPGREGKVDFKLFNKADFKAKKEGKGAEAEEARVAKAAKIIEFLGGPDNIVDVDSCASRLRLTVKDSSIADLNGIKALGGTTGSLVKGNSIHIVYGGEQEAIKPRMNKLLEEMRNKSS
ncbi:PTS transporter subunit EIIC [Spiroplasma taiwanense]|uniref:PTS system glucose-specific IIBC component n=1 Tax=Spiroplasma taiwanense CT-1 TaxID=1276220 RepID=S5LXD8_9MOLU|nr:PTS transporter subunit EIIC [Spiroplasma taiwanense]AGR41276.1 PTS system glucose-specific IIBC component [Spiroplasma taiwanense CT-1]